MALVVSIVLISVLSIIIIGACKIFKIPTASISRQIAIGSLSGILLTLIPLTFFIILNNNQVSFGDHKLVLLLLTIIQLPIVIISKYIGLSIFDMTECFIICPLNNFGMLFLIIIYGIFGGFVGYVFNKNKLYNRILKFYID